MAFKFFKEEIEIASIAKDYGRNYSDIPENDFMSMVKMDPSSYPKAASGFDINQDPVKVGNLASGGGGGLLIRCYRKGEKDFLNEFERVQNACAKYLQNRGSYSIKNAGAFNSVADFLNYVESDGTAEIGASIQPVQQKKKQTPEEKLEVLRQKQFPQIETVQELIDIANLDEESDTEHGQIGNIARNFLLPHYAKGERDFLNKKVSLKRAIAKYYNLDTATLKEKPLNSYSTVMDFIKDLMNNSAQKDNLMLLLNQYTKINRDYKLICQSQNYDVIQYWTRPVGLILDRCDYPVDKVLSEYGPTLDDLYNWGSDVSYDGDMGTNTWCTGWSGCSYWNSYSEGGGCILIAFIKRDRIPFRKEANLNWQVSIYKSEKHINSSTTFNFKDVEDGNNNHEGTAHNLPGFIAMLRQNKDILPYLLSLQEVRECKPIMDLTDELHITTPKTFSENDISFGWDENEIEVEPEPFIYTGTNSFEKYKQDNEDPDGATITTLVIGDDVTKIPNFEFQNLKNLNKIVFSDSVKEIGHKAFAGCNALPKISLPVNLEKIGMGAFESCTVLRGSIRLPLSLKYIGKNAFTNYVVGDFKSPISQKIKFTLSPKRLDTSNYPEPLLIAENEVEDYVNKISISDN